MRFSENRVIAWIVLAVCVIGSVVGLGGAGMARERNEAVEVYFEGTDDRDSAHCMQAYVDRAFENARIMAKEVQVNLSAEDVYAAAALEVLDAHDSANDEDFFYVGAACKELRELSDDLYNEMYAANLPDDRRVNFKSAYDDFWGVMKLIEKDPYLELAEDFNDKREASFVSELVCLIRGVDRLWESF